MPITQFADFPDDARLWVFGAAAPVTGAARDTLLQRVDQHLAQWAAHGMPLVCAREWRDDHFLAIAVDEAATGASGCSIDGLFRVLASSETAIGTSMVGGGRVFWREANGAVAVGNRDAFGRASTSGAVSAATSVFDTTVGTVGEWRARFEQPAAASWHARLLR